MNKKNALLNQKTLLRDRQTAIEDLHSEWTPAKRLPGHFQMELDWEHRSGPIRPLLELNPGQSGRIVSLNTSHLECARELAALGVTPGAFLTMLAVYPQHMIFRIERRKIAVDKEAIKGISVQAFDLL